MKYRRKYKKGVMYYFDTTDYIQYKNLYVTLQKKCIFWFTVKKYTIKLKTI